jgi:membrane associated rhomboid family serine protease
MDASDEGRGGVPDPEASERDHGLLLETCYRHPNVVTGVHCTRCGRPICVDCMYQAAVGYQCPECLREAARSAPRRRVRIRFVLGRPGIVTTTLLAANLAMFLVEVAYGGARSLIEGPNALKLYQLGALQPLTIAQDHQYWRFFTAMFLHAGLIHIAFNMYALYLFGYLIEGALGRGRLLAIYFVSGFLASVGSFLASDPRSVGVGASGAIFGLLGAWVAYNYRRRGSPMAAFQLRQALFLIVLNLFIGFSIANIDNSAHIGGLIAGVAAGFVAEGWGPSRNRQAIMVVGFAGLVALGVVLAVYRTAALASFGG